MLPGWPPFWSCSSVSPAPRCHAFRNIAGEYQRPPSRNAESAAASTASQLTSGMRLPLFASWWPAAGRPCGRPQQAAEIFPELADGAVEVADVAVAAREHHAALHRRQDELRERAPVDVRRYALARRDEAFLDRVGPVREVLRQPLAHGRVGLVQLEREAADGAAVGALGLDQRVAVAVHQLPDLLDRVDDSPPGRLEQHLPDAADVGVEHRDQQVLLAGKEVVEAAAVDARAGQDVGDGGRAKALLPEEVHGRLEDAPAGVDRGLIDHSTKCAAMVTPVQGPALD